MTSHFGWDDDGDEKIPFELLFIIIAFHYFRRMNYNNRLANGDSIASRGNDHVISLFGPGCHDTRGVRISQSRRIVPMRVCEYPKVGELYLPESVRISAKWRAVIKKRCIYICTHYLTCTVHTVHKVYLYRVEPISGTISRSIVSV